MRPDERFLAERLTGIGGSDVGDVLNAEPWGCAKRLWYEKRQIPPDYAIPENKLMLRGQKLEVLIADEYEAETGRTLWRMGMVRHADFPVLLVHNDRGISDSERGVGVLEIKTAGERQFYKFKRDGLPHAYVAQLQHAMYVSGAKWGAFALFWPDGWELKHWDVERDDSLCEALKDECLKFWALVENGPPPDRLEPTDRRCHRCPWRTSCQGEALKALCKEGSTEGYYDNALAPLAKEYLELREMRDETEGLLEAASERLKAAMGARPAAETPGARIYFRPITSMRWDTKALDKDFPELAPRYKKPSVSRPLKVYPI